MRRTAGLSAGQAERGYIQLQPRQRSSRSIHKHGHGETGRSRRAAAMRAAVTEAEKASEEPCDEQRQEKPRRVQPGRPVWRGGRPGRRLARRKVPAGTARRNTPATRHSGGPAPPACACIRSRPRRPGRLGASTALPPAVGQKNSPCVSRHTCSAVARRSGEWDRGGERQTRAAGDVRADGLRGTVWPSQPSTSAFRAVSNDQARMRVEAAGERP